jgi:GTP-binding protein
MVQVNTELALYDAELATRPQIVAVNKTDLPEVQGRIEEIRQVFRDAGTPVEFISAETGAGVPD